jgi:FkbM family methyltransferase
MGGWEAMHNQLTLRNYAKGLVVSLSDIVYRKSRAVRTIIADLMGARGALLCKFNEDHVIVFFPGDFIGEEILARGTYDRRSAKLVAEAVGPRFRSGSARTIVEVGANIGTHTIYLDRELRPERFLCIEPDPENARVLRANLLLNGLSGKAGVLELGASDRNGTQRFMRMIRNRGGSYFSEKEKLFTSDIEQHVAVDRLDDILASEGIEPETIGLVWMDVEGHELKALAGMTNILAARVPIYFELDASSHTAESIRSLAHLLRSGEREVYVCDGEKLDRIEVEAISIFRYTCNLLVL